MNINNDNVKASKSDNKTKNLIISSNFDQIPTKKSNRKTNFSTQLNFLITLPQ